MKKESRIVLIICLILYVLEHIIVALKGFNVDIPKFIDILTTINVQVIPIILFAYAWNKGHDSIAKIGLGAYVINIILVIVNGLFKTDLMKTNYDLYKALLAVKIISSSGVSLFELLAIYTIFDIDDKVAKGIQIAGVLSVIISTIIDLMVYLVSYKDYYKIAGTMSKISILIALIYSLSRYGYVLYYFIMKPEEVSSNSVPEENQQQNTINELPVQNNNQNITNQQNTNTNPVGIPPGYQQEIPVRQENGGQLVQNTNPNPVGVPPGYQQDFPVGQVNGGQTVQNTNSQPVGIPPGYQQEINPQQIQNQTQQ